MVILWIFGTWLALTLGAYMVFFATAWLARLLAVLACAGSAFSIGLGARIVAEIVGAADGATVGALIGVAAFILTTRYCRRAFARDRALRECGGEAP